MAVLIDEETGLFFPGDFKLEQKYSNPFNPQTTIEYQLPVSGHIILRIYNLLGQEVRTLVDENQLARSYSVVWDGKDDSGNDMPGGIYFYQMVTKYFVQTRKLLLLK